MIAPQPDPHPGPARPPTASRTLERALKRGASRVVAALFPAPRASAADVRAAPVRSLLVVRQHNQMGDMVCALPALAALRRAFPAAQLTFVASPLAEELLRGHPDIDRLLVVRKAALWRPWKLAALIRALRRPRPDLAVVMTTVSFSTTSALLAWTSGARWRAGASSVPFGSHLSRAVFHLELPAGPQGVHEVEHNLAPLAGLGIVTEAGRPRLVSSPAARAAAEAFVARTLPGEGPLLAVQAGAGKQPNRWPVENFARALQELRERTGARVVLLEGPRDADVVGDLAARLGAAVRWQAPLDATFGILSLARALLSNDTGMAHVAAALGTPTVVLFGPTDPRRWKPPGDHVVAVCAPHGRIAAIETGAVVDAVLPLLAPVPAVRAPR